VANWLPEPVHAAPPPEAFFLPAQPGQRLCIHHAPRAGGVLGMLLYVHPFAEEMNKSRRMAALQSRALAEAGYAVLQVDLLGCGDSSGDFGDASWSAWVADVVLAFEWLRARYQAPAWLWGLRAGCLLTAAAAPQLGTAVNFLHWQPTPAGKLVLQQFLRLKLAGDLQSGQSRAVMAAMRERLAADETLEVAGYNLPSAQAQGLEQARLQPPAQAGRVEWLEVSSRDDAALLPASAPVVAAWQAAGMAVRTQVVSGAAFWQTTEIEDAPALIAATLAALQAGGAA